MKRKNCKFEGLNKEYIEYLKGSDVQEYSDGVHFYDNGNLVYSEDSDGLWSKREYDDNGNIIYLEDSYGYWFKREYDENDNEIYAEDNNGRITDERKKEVF